MFRYIIYFMFNTCSTHYDSTYIRRSNRDINRVKGLNSFMFKHPLEANHPPVELKRFKVLNAGFCYKKFKMKISSTFFIKP